MEFDLTIHWAQVAATVATTSGVFASLGFIATPVLNRRARVREAGIKAGIEEVVRTATEGQTAEIRSDLTELHGALVAVQTQSNATDLVLATQFGGNGNGLRQELNSLSTIVAGLAGRVDGYFTGKGLPSG